MKRQLLVTGAELVHLKASFRGRPSIQALVNAAFEPAMRGNDEGSQAEYVPLEAVRPEIDTRPTVVVLPVPRPYVDYGNRALITRRQISASFPDAVGAFVEWLLERSGWTIEEPGQSGVVIPIRARHVCILFRNLKSWNEDVTRPYFRALEARRLPHVLVGGRSFYEREEVLAIRNALMAIEWPDDDLRVFATLRGPFFALTDDSLLAFRHTHRSLHPLRWLDDDRREALAASDRDVAEALEIVAHLHVQRNRHPIAQTIERLLGATRAHAGIAIWPTGEQALANCFRTVDLARRFERRGSPSFRAFVEYLEDEAERGESRDAPVVEEGTEGVRMMTVHKAKGLEFPIVILADPTCNATSVKPSRHVVPERGLWAESLCGCVPPDLRDAEAEESCRDLEEAVRVAYVAAIRARDLLVIPGIGDLDANDERTDGWLEDLGPTMYPVRETRRRPEPSPGCPAFGSDSTYERPVSCSRDATASVAPGLHRSAPGGSAITWWDPALLRLDTQEAVGLRQQRILHADKNATSASEAGIENHEKWQKRRLATLETGSVPSLRVQAITGVAAARATPREDLNRIQVVVDETLLDGTARPHGRRFGILIHAVVATVDLDVDRAGVEAATRIQGRLLGASEDEVAAAADAVEAALTHELLRSSADAARKGNIRRETPVLLRLEDGALGEGVIDLAFREGSTWTLVDFKTDRELAHNRQRYETQVQLYAHAIREATAEEVKAVLLLV